jgi:hypothetical protein
MLRPTLDVPYPLPPQFLLELRLSSPHRVLSPLVRQDLLRHPVLRDRTRQRLQHQLRLLVMQQRPPDDESRVVVHEGAQVQTLVSAKQEREDVRLPQLIRRRALETSRPVLTRWRPSPRLRDQPLLVQDPSHLRLADP